MKKISSIYLLIVIFFTSTGCSLKYNMLQEPPEIIITIDKQAIEYVAGKNKWNNKLNKSPPLNI